MDNPLRNGFQVGEWQVRPIEGQITGPAGSLHLEPKVMDTLVCLASNAGNVAERDTLLVEVWGNTLISDEPLTRCIATLRKSLGDDPQKPRYIQTVPKRGYRLVADVSYDPKTEKSDADKARLPQPKRRRVALYMIVVTAFAIAAVALYRTSITVPDSQISSTSDGPAPTPADGSSVVVLPFELAGANHELTNLGRTISADLVTLLSNVDGLSAKSMLYVDSLVAKGMTPIEISDELDASHLLQGRIETEHDIVTLSLELIDVSNGDVAWSETYDDDLAGLIRLQYAVVDSVAVNVGIAPLAYPGSEIHNVDPQAYRLYVRARGISNPARPNEIVDLLTKAIEYDPDFAKAHSMLALQYMIRGWASEDRFGPFLDAAMNHASTATKLDPELIEPRMILANIHALRYEWTAAREVLDTVSRSSPDALPAAPVVINFGNVQQAIEISKQMYADNPFSDGLTFQTVYYSIAGEFDRALQAAEIAERNGQLADVSRLGVYHAKNGDIETATKMFEIFLPLWGFDPALAEPYARSIATGQVTAEFQKGLDAADKALEANSMFFHVCIGSPADLVFELANRLYDEKRLNIIAFYEPWAVQYRADPRFVDLVDKIGLLDYWRQYGPPDFCSFVDDTLKCT